MKINAVTRRNCRVVDHAGGVLERGASTALGDSAALQSLTEFIKLSDRPESLMKDRTFYHREACLLPAAKLPPGKQILFAIGLRPPELPLFPFPDRSKMAGGDPRLWFRCPTDITCEGYWAPVALTLLHFKKVTRNLFCFLTAAETRHNNCLVIRRLTIK